jgi:glycosyltransferase involved in cell wall biosynthesis
MKVLFLTRYDLRGGSSRYMVYSYLEFYEQAGIQCTVSPLFDDRYFDWQILDHPTGLREIVRHSSYYLARVLERLRWVLASAQYDLVMFEKELIPYSPYGLEAVLQHRQSKTVALFDDATYTYYRDHPLFWVRLFCRHKIDQVMRHCAHVIVWNDYLANYARQLNPNVSVVNTGIDLRRYRVKEYQGNGATSARPTSIGWIGTPNSFPYIRPLEDVFKELSSRYNIELHVISSQDYVSPNIRVVNKPWSIQTEVADLLSLDIGIMPLPDDEWTRGKSGAKAVQYMGVGVPAVCSAVGVATNLIQDGANGFLATSISQWTDRLALLIENPALRREIGLRGRQTVETTYSIQAVAPRLIGILQQVAEGT